MSVAYYGCSLSTVPAVSVASARRRSQICHQRLDKPSTPGELRLTVLSGTYRFKRKLPQNHNTGKKGDGCGCTLYILFVCFMEVINLESDFYTTFSLYFSVYA